MAAEAHKGKYVGELGTGCIKYVSYSIKMWEISMMSESELENSRDRSEQINIPWFVESFADKLKKYVSGSWHKSATNWNETKEKLLHCILKMKESNNICLIIPVIKLR